MFTLFQHFLARIWNCLLLKQKAWNRSAERLSARKPSDAPKLCRRPHREQDWSLNFVITLLSPWQSERVFGARSVRLFTVTFTFLLSEFSKEKSFKHWLHTMSTTCHGFLCHELRVLSKPRQISHLFLYFLFFLNKPFAGLWLFASIPLPQLHTYGSYPWVSCIHQVSLLLQSPPLPVNVLYAYLWRCHLKCGVAWINCSPNSCSVSMTIHNSHRWISKGMETQNLHLFTALHFIFFLPSFFW